jgi:hypothetical protein
MNHDFESKEWADNHHLVSDGIDRLFSHIGNMAALAVRPVGAKIKSFGKRQASAPIKGATAGSNSRTGRL